MILPRVMMMMMMMMMMMVIISSRLSLQSHINEYLFFTFPNTQNSILISSKAVYLYRLCCHSSRTAVELDGWRSNLKGC